MLNLFKNYNYLADTHTAVALASADMYIAESGDNTPMVVASTASPYKFAADVCKSLGMEKPTDDMDALDMLSNFSKTEISYPLRGLNDREVRFNRVIDANQMLDVVKEYVK